MGKTKKSSEDNKMSKCNRIVHHSFDEVAVNSLDELSEKSNESKSRILRILIKYFYDNPEAFEKVLKKFEEVE